MDGSLKIVWPFKITRRTFVEFTLRIHRAVLWIQYRRKMTPKLVYSARVIKRDVWEKNQAWLKTRRTYG